MIRRGIPCLVENLRVEMSNAAVLALASCCWREGWLPPTALSLLLHKIWHPSKLAVSWIEELRLAEYQHPLPPKSKLYQRAGATSWGNFESCVWAVVPFFKHASPHHLEHTDDQTPLQNSLSSHIFGPNPLHCCSMKLECAESCRAVSVDGGVV